MAVAPNYNLKVYAFDNTTTATLVQIAAASLGTVNDTVYTLDWSADGNYLVVGGTFSGSSTQDLRVFSFNPQLDNPLLQVAANNPGTGLTTDSVYSVAWSPDGSYIATGGMYTGTSNDVVIYNALLFPQRNIIQGNTTSCITSASSTAATGIGIAGSSIANLIIANQAYNNIMNYQFVVNSFKQLFQAVPSPLENRDLTANEPINNPGTIGLSIVGIESQTIDMTSKLAALLATL
jgi:WD40 repeat protein